VHFWSDSLKAIALISLVVCAGVFLIPRFILPLVDQRHLTIDLIIANLPTIINLVFIIIEIFLAIRLQSANRFPVLLPSDDSDKEADIPTALSSNQLKNNENKRRRIVKWVFCGLIYPDIVYVLIGLLGLLGATIAGLFIPLIIGQLVDAFKSSEYAQADSISMRNIVFELLAIFTVSSLMQL
jgi:hypothetical protein